MRVAAKSPPVIKMASPFLVALYQTGYRCLGKKRRKKKSAPKRVATKTQKTMVRHSAAMMSSL